MYLIYESNFLFVLNFESHILNLRKNAGEVLSHTFVPYIQVMIKHNTSFQIIQLSILHINSEKW